MHIPFSRKKVLFCICAVVIVAGGVYIGLHRKAVPSSVPQAPAAVSTAGMAVDWNALLPQVSAALGQYFSPSDIGSRSPISVAQVGDVTGDGLPEAFIDMGYGGASSDDLALVGYQNGNVVVLSYKDINLPPAPVDFSQGAAALYANGVGMDSADNAIYMTELTYKSTDGSLDTCSLTAFKWDPENKYFNIATDIGLRLQKTYCATAASGNAEPQ